MKKVNLILVLTALLFSVSSWSKNYIVKTKPAAFNSFAKKSFANTNMNILESHEKGLLHKLEIKGKNAAKIVAELHVSSEVEYIVEDFKLQAFRAPMNNVQLKEQWAMAKVRAKEAWSIAGNKGSRNVLVAVIDTGVDYNHESLRSNMVPGQDYLENDGDPMDDVGAQNPGHGTHCAGVIGADGMTNGGIIGISPEVSLMPLRFLGANGQGDLMAGIKSIDHAIEKGAKVISASWGAAVARSQAQPLIDAVERADKAGVIFVAAAGNDGKNNDSRDIFPANARFANTIAVAASDSNDGKPSWSNFGKSNVDIAAPGHNIMSTIPNNKYRNLSGTSMATPMVAGLVALLAAQDEDITGAQVRSLMQVTGTQVNIETACNCRVDAAEAVKTLKNEGLVVVPAAASIAENATLQMSAFNAKGATTFTSSNPEVATISAEGMLTAKAKGEVKITASDASGKKATSLNILIGAKASDGGNGGGGNCPFGDQSICDQLCQMNPSFPFCK